MITKTRFSIYSEQLVSQYPHDTQVTDVLNGNSSLNDDQVNQLIENITRVAIMISGSDDTPSFPEDLAAINKLLSSSLDVLLNSNVANQTNIIQPYVSMVL